MKSKKKIVTDFGLELRRMRRNFGYTIRYIADAIGKSPATVVAIENGKANAPKPAILRKWLAALHMEERYEELNERARLNRTHISIKLRFGRKANQHLARIIDAYESDELSSYDMAILSLVARVESPYKEAK